MRKLLLVLCGLAVAGAAKAGPYPALSGITAAADDAGVAGYNRPVSDRLRIGFGALYVDDMVDDDQRTLTLRLDSMWAAGVGVEWQWTPTRVVSATLIFNPGVRRITNPPDNNHKSER